MKQLLKKRPKEERKETLPAVEKPDVTSYFRSYSDRRYIFRLTLTLLIITVVAAMLLGFVYYKAGPIIDQRTREKTEEAMRSVLDADYYRGVMDFVPVNGVTDISQAVNGGVVTGYVCQVENNGFGGAISMVVGIDLEGFVTGVSVVKHAETRNIGTKVVESEAVLRDFVGLSGFVTISGGEEGFDAVSGATYSSKAVLEGVNAALSAVEQIQMQQERSEGS